MTALTNSSPGSSNGSTERGSKSSKSNTKAILQHAKRCMALVLLFEDLVLRSVKPLELPGDEFVRAVTSASKTVKEKRE